MSAWIVNREHIDVLVAAGLRGPRGREVSPDTAWHELRWFAEAPSKGPFEDYVAASREYERVTRRLDYTTADDVGRMLWTENVCSVSARYPGDDPSSRPGPVSDDIDGEAIAYVWRDPHYKPTAGEILQTIGCYEYQTCEHEDWSTSEAKRFCEALRDAVCGTLYEGPWGWDAESLEQAKNGALLR